MRLLLKTEYSEINKPIDSSNAISENSNIIKPIQSLLDTDFDDEDDDEDELDRYITEKTEHKEIQVLDWWKVSCKVIVYFEY
jgi:hypothetical protein